jgi:hypothetical protein
VRSRLHRRSSVAAFPVVSGSGCTGVPEGAGIFSSFRDVRSADPAVAGIAVTAAHTHRARARALVAAAGAAPHATRRRRRSQPRAAGGGAAYGAERGLWLSLCRYCYTERQRRSRRLHALRIRNRTLPRPRRSRVAEGGGMAPLVGSRLKGGASY